MGRMSRGHRPLPEIKMPMARMTGTVSRGVIVIVIVVIIGSDDSSVHRSGGSVDRGGVVLYLDLHTPEAFPVAPPQHEIGGLGRPY